MANDMLVIVEDEKMLEAAEEVLAEFPEGSATVVTRAQLLSWFNGMVQPIQKAVDELLAKSGEAEADEPEALVIFDPPDPQEIAKAARETWKKNGTGDANSAKPGERG